MSSSASALSNDSPQSVSVALSTDVVLLHIFQYVGVKDLLDCRLVNQKWHAIASEALYSRRLYLNENKLFITWQDIKGAYKDFNDRRGHWKALNFLIDRMSSNINFRFLGFVIQNGGFSQENFQEFAKSCGKYVRLLEIDDLGDTTGLPEALACFTEIEHLRVGYVGNLGNPDARFLRLENGSEIRFPKLRSLEVTCPHINAGSWDSCGTKQLCEEVIRASPELKSIESFDVCLAEVALECEKLETAVTDLNFDVEELCETLLVLKNLPYLEFFSLNSPPLKSFFFRGVYWWLQFDDSPDPEDDSGTREEKERFLASLNRILAASKDSLTQLRMDYLDQPQKFTKLTSLDIVDRLVTAEIQPYRIFPTEWKHSPSFYFPALKTARLELRSSLNRDSVKTYFGELEKDAFPTVTTLELECDFDHEGIQALGATFPNVKTLRVFWDKKTKPCLSDLWLFSPTLEVLEIMNFGVEMPEIFSFDWNIIGFDPQVCSNLRKLPRIPYDARYLDAFRTRPSILKLRGLKRFSVHFVCSDPEEAPNPDLSASPIANWYALDLMPELRTHFLYDFKGKHAETIAKFLEPYKSYVTILSRESSDW